MNLPTREVVREAERNKHKDAHVVRRYRVNPFVSYDQPVVQIGEAARQHLLEKRVNSKLLLAFTSDHRECTDRRDLVGRYRHMSGHLE